MKTISSLFLIGVAVIVVLIFFAGIIKFDFLKGNKIAINPALAGKEDKVLIIRGRAGVYGIQISTKELKPYTRPEDTPVTFTGLPTETKNNQTSVYMGSTLLSDDKARVIVVFHTLDETKEPNGFDGSLPIIKADEFICDIATQKCTATDVLASAYKATGFTGKWFGHPMVWWYRWDSVKNLLYGHLTGEGVGNASPVYVFDATNNSLQQTTGYNSVDEEEKRAGVPVNAFSPSLTRFVMVEENRDSSGSVASIKWNLILYDSKDLSTPTKKIDVTEINEPYNGTPVNSVAWSKDEKMLVLLTNSQVFTLNLESGEISRKYVDIESDTSGLRLDFNAVDLSPSGRYIVFVDYDKSVAGNNVLQTVLKAIDLRDNNKVIELLREEGLHLYR